MKRSSLLILAACSLAACSEGESTNPIRTDARADSHKRTDSTKRDQSAVDMPQQDTASPDGPRSDSTHADKRKSDSPRSDHRSYDKTHDTSHGDVAHLDSVEVDQASPDAQLVDQAQADHLVADHLVVDHASQEASAPDAHPSEGGTPKKGKTDLCAWKTDSTGWYLYCALSKSDGTLDPYVPAQEQGDVAPTSVGDKTGYNAFPIELNGDGKQDFCFTKIGTSDWATYCILSDGTGDFKKTVNATSQGPLWGGYQVSAADVDGDGKTDLCAWLTSGSGWFHYCALSASDGTFYNYDGQNVYSGNLAGYQALPIDANGDGKSDYCIWKGNSVHCILSDGSENFGNKTIHPTTLTSDWTGFQVVAIDANGDSKVDLCAWKIAGGELTTTCALSKNDGTFEDPSGGKAPGTAWTGYQVFAADVNGDARMDLCAWKIEGGEWSNSCLLADVNGKFGTPVSGKQPGTTWTGYHVVAADVDGDGKTDLCAWNTTDNWYAYCALSKGDGSFNNAVGGLQTGSGWTGFSVVPAQVD